ncbi:glycoside hydrolase family protein [Spirosoma sordidisoli]|uniref:Right-handed parallel beta-helix repeat-containing protein n=1 Tax=Spirosoma sordidisoli TaxID=2502893 RepID=A0A4Q2UTG3_9BACT|nr:hypothetical protein [Spirosoma sordidisoli]RYC70109.1 hypothetical protein EQG79_09565 [Spirosoma sordidisoli]
MKISPLPIFLLLFVMSICSLSAQSKKTSTADRVGFTDAASFGFSPSATGLENALALQKAVDLGGTIIVSQPGTYKLGGTVYLGSHTSLVFGDGVFIKKVNEKEDFSHVFINKGAATKTYNEHITVDGLQIIVNGMDVRKFNEAYGLHGQLAFFYVKDLRINRFRCLDLGKAQYGIHICTFEDVIIDDVIIKGEKDGVHFGRGKRFTVRNGVFQTFDDAIALNAHDYATGNPELGWIENGVIENCHDLNAENTTGYFCRILAGAWTDWQEGMAVQQSDAVVSNGKLYRVQAKPDGTIYTSKTRPTHDKGSQVLDGINWGVVQNDITYTAGVRNVIFRNIFLEKPRIGLSIHFDNDKYSRSYYPGAAIPLQEQLSFDNVRVLHNKPIPFLSIATPVDLVTISNSSIRNNTIKFVSNKAMTDYLKTSITIYGCSFHNDGEFELITNGVAGKKIHVKTFGNTELNDKFSAKVNAGNGQIIIDSDLTGLKK